MGGIQIGLLILLQGFFTADCCDDCILACELSREIFRGNTRIYHAEQSLLRFSHQFFN